MKYSKEEKLSFTFALLFSFTCNDTSIASNSSSDFTGSSSATTSPWLSLSSFNSYIFAKNAAFLASFATLSKQFIETLYPKHFPHEYSDLTKQKSNLVTLPKINSDEAKHQDCVKILRTYESWIWQLYSKAGLTTEEMPEFDINFQSWESHANPG